MREIGGYFGLEQLVSNEYYKELISLNNGRSALLYVLKARSIKKIYIPYYLCDSISNMIKRNDYNFEYYNIDFEFKPIFNKKLDTDEYMYIVNYYGQLNKSDINNLKNKYERIIVDNTQAFFQKPVNEVDTLYSCRKFLGVPDGAYLSISKKIKEDLDIDISKTRVTHLLGRYEGIASEYYNDFQKSDKTFDMEPLKFMSKFTHNILGAIDYEKIRQIRNENYAYLENRIGKYNKLKLKAPDGAFAYPFYIENGIEIRKILTKNKIYVPTLWPNVLAELLEDSIEYKYVANILPLPCDQRYMGDDMEILVNEIIKLLEV